MASVTALPSPLHSTNSQDGTSFLTIFSYTAAVGGGTLSLSNVTLRCSDTYGSVTSTDLAAATGIDMLHALAALEFMGEPATVSLTRHVTLSSVLSSWKRGGFDLPNNVTIDGGAGLPALTVFDTRSLGTICRMQPGAVMHLINLQVRDICLEQAVLTAQAVCLP